MKKIALIATVIGLMIGLSACNIERVRDGEKQDLGRTQLYVGTFEGGYGEEWLNSAKAKFEEKYKEVSFEEGKKGVQVIIRSSRSYTGVELPSTIRGLVQDVFFTEAVYYYDLVNQGLLLDITDVITEPLNYDFTTKQTTTGETVSIESKMRDGHINFFKTPENKYYGIPFYEANYGITYDVDLFEEEGLYFAKEGLGNSYGFITNPTMERSAGPDGDYSTTYDNGLPATYEDFFKLADYMVRKNIVPITWGGNVQPYVSSLMAAFWADFEGYDQMMLNYTFDGQANNLVSGFDNQGKPITYSEQITEDNGYLTYGKQAGRYHALSFLDQLLSNGSYYNSALTFSPAHTHRDAQDAFLTGKYLSSRDTVGMLIDGTWWQHEAGAVFESMVKAYGESASQKNRRFAVMPIPKVDSDHLGTFTILESNYSMAFINGNVESWKQPLAKAFLQFVHTDEMLKDFTRITNTFKPFNYTLSEAELNELTYWGQSLYHLHQNATFVTPYAYNEIYLRNISSYSNELDMWNSQVKNQTMYNIPSSAMFNNNITGKEYFEGFSYFWTENYWNSRRN